MSETERKLRINNDELREHDHIRIFTILGCNNDYDVYKTVTSNASGEYLFKDNILVKKYWIKADGLDSGHELSGDSTATVIAEQSVLVDVIMSRTGGSLEIFVRKDQETGQHMKATVELFRSFEDKNNNAVFKTAECPGDSVNGAMFINLEAKYYHVVAEFMYDSKKYEGSDSVLVKIGKNTTRNVVCI